MNSEVQNPVAKTACAWGAYCASELLNALGITTWAEAAAFFGTIYTLTLLGEWFWKKLWRPLFVHFGLMKPKGEIDAG
jgi:hypothetical protein